MWDQRAGWQLCGGAVDRVVVVRVVVVRQVFESVAIFNVWLRQPLVDAAARSAIELADS